MEYVDCKCRECDGLLGEFANLWTKIGKNYFSPILDVRGELATIPIGEVRIGDEGTLVGDCRLRDISCSRCSAVVGIQCVNTPVNHVLDDEQLLLRLNSVKTVKRGSSVAVDLNFKRNLQLRDQSHTATAGLDFSDHDENNSSRERFSEAPNFLDINQFQADLQDQRRDIDRIDASGAKFISALYKALENLQGEFDRIKGDTSKIQQDIGENHDDIASLKTEIGDVRQSVEDSTTVSRLQHGLQTVQSGLEDVRKNISSVFSQFRKDIAGVRSEQRRNQQDIEDLRAAVRDSVSARDHAKDLAVMRNELAQLRKQVEDARTKGAERSEAAFPSRELDILTSNIAKIGNKASQVESLQMEFEILKGRVERMESNRHTPDERVSFQSSHAKEPAYVASHQDVQLPNNELSTTRRKRRSSGLSPAPTKRHSSSAEFATVPSSALDGDRSSEWATISSNSNLPGPSAPTTKVKLTKNGKVDKRTQRRTARTR